MKKYFIIGGVALFVLAIVLGKMFLGHFEKSIRQGERRIIALELEKQKAEKEGRVMGDVARKTEIINNATDSELTEYFRSGKLPDRTGGKGSPPKHNKPGT